MKRKILIGLSIIIVLLGYIFYSTGYSMESLPKGDFICEKESPDGTYTIKAYITNGGATTSFAIRGELNYNKEKKSAKNIYWNNREDNAIIEWIDDNTVIINGHKLKVPDEKFDFRRED
ncbi:DUF5412 domain-containing protein [Clostridium sp. C2-6-12]|uniref:DUF5412 domain-containing protein n=1 Tax=Clostridium sp. C2-6-12 TaxID=2698832 RepID=UPI001370B151|nr:DUF5412 domain-containing protein [Clostridium sp. C2-6-12]